MAKKRKPVETCSVKWCVALAVRGQKECAVHVARGIRFRVGGEGEPTPHCDECDGSGECLDCDGEGERNCEHGSCDHSHECPSCDGTGECQYCEIAKDTEALDANEARYIAFAFDTGLAPLPALYDSPWESASDVN